MKSTLLFIYVKKLKNNYFIYEIFFRPTELDALVFGHLFSIITTPLLNNRFAATVRAYDNLVQLCVRIETEFYQSRIL